jgi:transposase
MFAPWADAKMRENALWRLHASSRKANHRGVFHGKKGWYDYNWSDICKSKKKNQPILIIPTMQRNRLSFKGQKIYIGIDVHKTTWQICVLTETGFSEKHAQKASAQELFDFLKKHYPDGEYHAVYESGFSGFSTYYALTELGIHCSIVHAADVPTTQYESLMKTDKVDAVKLARALRNGTIHSVYIREKENLDDLAVMRVRKAIMKDLSSFKTRVKHMLHCHGVALPERFNTSSTYWSKTFMDWLRNDVKLLSSTRVSLDLLINHVESDRRQLLEATRALRNLGKLQKYDKQFDLLISIPGIGATTAMCILTEIYDIKRFQNERQFASYLGLIPSCHNSGEKVSAGEMTCRGNKEVQTMLIEASWVAVRKDIIFSEAYSNFLKRGMNSQKAIVRVARKLSNTIFAILKNQKKYDTYKCI